MSSFAGKDHGSSLAEAGERLQSAKFSKTFAGEITATGRPPSLIFAPKRKPENNDLSRTTSFLTEG